MSPESLQNLFALAFGFAAAGLCASAFRLATDRLPSFTMLSVGARPVRLAAVPLLILAAPFLIMRNTLVGVRQESRRFKFAFAATLIASFWSLMSGLVLLSALQACGLA
jgi:O-antigen/teichoic acid export membrane protein